jgi:multisubunit Na+/H+ antiporter MnhE subunit
MADVRTMSTRAVFWLGQAILFLLLWLLFVNTTDFYELLIGGGVAALAATASELTREQAFARFAPRLSWLLQIWRMPWYVIEGCATIVWALAKHFVKPEPSVLRSVVYDAGSSDPASAARRALTIAYTTIPPNFVVLSIDLERDRMLVHQVSKSETPTMTRNLGAKS